MNNLQEYYDECWAVFHPHFPQLAKPKLTIRKMQRAWGVCHEQTRITLNRNLENAKPNFVRHVIFHEMCHLIHPHHKRDFYDLLKQFDPLQQKENQKIDKRVAALRALADEFKTTSL